MDLGWVVVGRKSGVFAGIGMGLDFLEGFGSGGFYFGNE